MDMVVNPILFPRPRSTRNWASKGVLGERVWAERNRIVPPAQFTAHVLNATYAFQAVGTVLLVYGLVVLGWTGLLAVVAGTAIVQCAKAWYIDRAVLLFEDMKARHPEYAAWEY